MEVLTILPNILKLFLQIFLIQSQIRPQRIITEGMAYYMTFLWYVIHSIHICASVRPGPGYVKMCRPGITTNQAKDQAIMSNMTYYPGVLVSAHFRHITRISNKSNLPYFSYGSGEAETWSGRPIVVMTTVAYATIFDPMLRVAWGWAGWQAAKNLSGFQKSARCGCVLPVVRYYAQDWVCRQLASDQYNSILRKNLRILATCVKSAIFCIICAMRGQSWASHPIPSPKICPI